MIRSVVRGIGSALPKRIMKNSDFEGVVETSDEWIVQRTGIRQRHIAGEGETTVSLGAAAARAALENAGLQASDIDLVLVATSTPNHTFPASAVEIQRELGITTGFAFDLQGFAVASSMPLRLLTSISVADSHVVFWLSAQKPSRAFSTGMIARPAFCLATVPARWFSKPAKARA